ncbi:iron ABC transporter permease [Desulfosporosinus sp. FKA]|uniref:ABC transporter permease n=1 Tax=Desulfosporosinus sp. FKA TaxID=1969834 RepID=UPI000B4A40C0|nr:iron ABC transporter permease [Desulfosporosinus sp. FKA]
MIIKHKKGRITKEQILNYILYAVVAFVFIAPVFRLLIMSFTVQQGYSIKNYTLLFQDKRTILAVKNTFVIVLASTLISGLFGSFFSFLIAYTNIKRKRFLELLILMPFIIPSYIITLSWTGILRTNGPINHLLAAAGIAQLQLYSMQGIIFILGICNIPIVYLSVVHMLRRIPRDLEWASRASGYTLWQTMLRINLVQAIPAILAGSVLAFLSAIDNFSVPAFLGISANIPVLSTYIYEKVISFGPSAFPNAAALSVILSGIAVSGIMVEYIFTKKSSHLDSIKEDFSVRIELTDSVRKTVEWITIIGLMIFNIIPIVYMLCSSFLRYYGLPFALKNLTLENFHLIFSNSGVVSALENSVLLASVTSIVCIIIGTIIAYLKVRKNNKAVKILENSASLTYAIPGIVLALSMIFHWVEPMPGFRPQIYGTISILIIAYITRYLILQIKGSTTAMLAVEPSLEYAAMASGTKLRMWLKIMIPLLIKPVLASSFLIFVSSMTELTLSSMLAAAGTKTIGLTIFDFQQSGDYNLAIALSSLIVILILAGYLLSITLMTEKNNLQERINESYFRKCNSKIQQYSGFESN